MPASAPVGIHADWCALRLGGFGGAEPEPEPLSG